MGDVQEAQGGAAVYSRRVRTGVFWPFCTSPAQGFDRFVQFDLRGKWRLGGGAEGRHGGHREPRARTEMGAETVTLNIHPEIFWGLVSIAGLMVGSGLLYLLISASTAEKRDPLQALKAQLGWESAPDVLVLFGVVLWSALLLTLVAGLFWMIWDVVSSAFPWIDDDETDARSDIIRLAGLTATIGGVVALPFTILRLKVSREQTDTQAASLFNEKINAASDDLHAMRQRTLIDESGYFGKTVWEADVTRRNAAIDRLVGLVDGRPRESVRVAQMLCVYVRELSQEYPAKTPPMEVSPRELGEWARELEPARPDFQTAISAIGRLKVVSGEDFPFGTIDLSRSNLQGLQFTDLNFSGADFYRASLDGSIFYGGEFTRASFVSASLCHTDFTSSAAQIASFSGSDLRGASFLNTRAQGSNFLNAEFNEETDVDGAKFRGAAMLKASKINLLGSEDRSKNVFSPPEGQENFRSNNPRAAYHSLKGIRQKEVLSILTFRRNWREWQKSIGFDPEDPSTWGD